MHLKKILKKKQVSYLHPRARWVSASPLIHHPNRSWTHTSELILELQIQWSDTSSTPRSPIEDPHPKSEASQ